MPCFNFASGDNVQLGMIEEAVCGTLETSGPYPRILTTGFGATYSSNILVDPTVTGEGQVVDARTNTEGGALTAPFIGRYNDNRTLISSAFRDVFPSAVTIVGSSDISVVLAGTHLDGSTGAQITIASATGFDALINYAGATVGTHPNGGGEGLMMRVSGSSEAANNRYRRIKAVHSNGVDTSFIDIAPGYVGGGAGLFGEPMVAVASESITIAVGVAVRNQFRGAGLKTYSALWNHTDLSASSWQAMTGLHAGDWSWSWSNRNALTGEVGFIPTSVYPLASSDPSGVGFVDQNLYSPMLEAANDLKTFAIVTATEPIVLSSLNLTGFSASMAGNLSEMNDVSGTSETVGVVRGGHALTGSIDAHLVDDARSAKLANLGRVGSREKGGIDALFTDVDGNDVILGVLKAEFQPSGTTGGGQNSTIDLATVNWTAQQGGKKPRMVVYQEIAAP